MKPDRIIIEGRAYSWKAIVALRKAQLEESRAAQMRQPALFPLQDDRRPEPERTAAGRYREPTLLAWMTDGTPQG
ncbi:MAG: hypothetical protein E5X57_22020 [Mesorhizobium sp.]|uniref:hypothetical protein n=1 Tax=Mesorhizobium sp. TaxID=1871066 RepID=UPI0012215D37|nr:hypothetical protein [Mesorhizobium sp.]TIQ08762.1 MAG: hypothetical protein E5X57_22020 [Mesorhizobium sp.]TJV92304.1 MAG: hypothetical protein E5X52_33620 [Mesorhizobium sp.]